MEKAIYFDCDGTIVDLYNVEDWLFHLHNYSVYPYVAARPLINMSSLARLLNRLQKMDILSALLHGVAKAQMMILTQEHKTQNLNGCAAIYLL